ncbi:hypothetical protein TCAL_17219 [Tigriopus californicus]|uniref:Uncharacterized protein n=1 Tax=Tigriopus californicus TaxID=6832 RepID=A0A553N704_TIGCA|nr:hypothetical protein TCAL_17219 [Tigriopus californicus]
MSFILGHFELLFGLGQDLLGGPILLGFGQVFHFALYQGLQFGVGLFQSPVAIRDHHETLLHDLNHLLDLGVVAAFFLHLLDFVLLLIGLLARFTTPVLIFKDFTRGSMIVRVVEGFWSRESGVGIHEHLDQSDSEGVVNAKGTSYKINRFLMRGLRQKDDQAQTQTPWMWAR